MSLFDLAHYCSVTPPQVNSLTVGDFAQLLSGIRQHKTRAVPGQP
jgi:hypothetical protein